MLTEAVLHTHAHGRPTLRNMIAAWNKMLQKEVEHRPSEKMDATAAFLASLEEPKFTSLADVGKKPPIEILPPGMPSLAAPISIKKNTSNIEFRATTRKTIVTRSNNYFCGSTNSNNCTSCSYGNSTHK